MPPPNRAASKTGRGVGVPPASVTTTYAYDDADRLTAVKQGKTTVKGHGYDAAAWLPCWATGARSRDPRGEGVDPSPSRRLSGR